MNNKDTPQQTHSTSSGNYRIWAAISLVASAIIAALTFTLAYNSQTGYLVGKIASILLVSAILIELAISLILVRANRIYINDGNRTTLLRVATLILHLAVIFCGVMAVIGSKNMIFSIDSLKNTAKGDGTVLPSDVLTVAIVVLSAIIFLSSPALRRVGSGYGAADQINGYSTIFLCILGIALLYFDMSVEMNNPQKLLLQFSLAAICLSKLYEMKSHIQGKGARTSLAFRLFSVTFAPMAATSAIIAFAAKGKSFPAFYLYFAIIVIAYALFYTVEILSSAKEE